MSPRTSPRKSRNALTRALVAVAGPALALSLAAAPAEAAKAPAVPTVAQAASVYPHLAGGTVTTSTEKVESLNKKCKYKPVRTAKGISADYTAPADPEDPASAYNYTGAKPKVSTRAYKFRTVKDAVHFLHPPKSYLKKCPKGHKPGAGGNPGDGMGCKAKISRIKFKLGNERTGYQMRCGEMVMQYFLVRAGKDIVASTMLSLDGTAPSKTQSLKFVKLALKVAR